MVRLRSFFVGLVLVAASFAAAQFPADPFGANVQYMPTLLLNPRVQKDMGVSPQVASKVQGILMEEGMKMMSSMGSRGQATAADQKKMADAAIATYHRMENRTLALLNRRQKTRLRQLSLQMLGPMALLQDNLGREVALTAPQKKQLSDVIMAENKYLFAGMSAGAGRSSKPGAAQQRVAEMAKKQKAARDASEAALAKILTPKQRAKWNSMLGHRIDLGPLGMGKMLGG